MDNIDTGSLRNVAFISHGGAGKTSLIETILFNAGAIKRIGNVEAGNTVMDFDSVEIDRKISINTKACVVQWNNYLLNILDTPGYGNFLHETQAALSVVGGAVVIASAISGIKAETERVWDFSERYDLSKLIFVNKMDRERADFFRTLGNIEKKFKVNPLPIFLPIGKEESFKGIIDLVKMKAYIYPDEPTAAFSIIEIPEEYKEIANKYRNKMVEAVSETDDRLIEKYLEDEELSEDEIRGGLREGTISKRFIPVICGSAVKNIGSKLMLEAITMYLPSPYEREFKEAENTKTNENVIIKPDSSFSAFVFKTFIDPFSGKISLFRVYSGMLTNESEVLNTSRNEIERINQLYIVQGNKIIKTDKVVAGQIAMVNKLKHTMTFDTLCEKKNPVKFDPISLQDTVITFSIVPKSKEDEDKVSTGLHRLMEEDPSIKLSRDEQSSDQLISGMGQMHIETIVERLKKKFGVEVNLETPKVPYKETILKTASGQGKYKKQSGGRGQYGDVWIELQPSERGSGIEFVDKIVGGAIPRQFIPAVEKGIMEACKEGVSGYPVVDIKAILYDGTFHSVDSSEMAFKIAASMAYKSVAMDAKPVVLEPIMNIDIYVPEDAVGNVIGDLNSKRGRIENVEPHKHGQHIKGKIPMSEILKYAPELRSMTGGRGIFSIGFDHYDELPSHLAEKIMDSHKNKV